MDSVTYWNAVPRRLLEWREADDGRCVLLRPKFGRNRLGCWLANRVGDPHYRIRLDELGTFVWKACDGETSLETIAARLRHQFGPTVEPAEQRLGLFVRKMLKSKVLALTQPPTPDS
jgi:hypothetical protein